MENLFEIRGDIRNFTKEEFRQLLSVLGQCCIDNFRELVILYETTYNCRY